MNLTKRKFTNRFLAVLDFGYESVVALVGEKRGEAFRLVGAGDARVRGIKGGLVTCVGDVVEGVVEALQKAERSAGAESKALYYNFDDPEIRVRRQTGTKTLTGEGEIQPADVRDACEMAERLVGDFEKRIVYSSCVRYLIDGRDEVENPVGVFGRKLDVEMLVLQANSLHCETWQRVMERAHIEKSCPVFSGYTSACAVDPKDGRGRLILDAGKDRIHAMIFQNGRIRDYRSGDGSARAGEKAWQECARLAREILKSPDSAEEILVTGDRGREEPLLDLLREKTGKNVRTANPLAETLGGPPVLNEPRFAAAVGLCRIADDLDRREALENGRKNVFIGVKEKAFSFIHEYF